MSRDTALAHLIDHIQSARAQQRALLIRVGGTKDWYGEPPQGEPLDARRLAGISSSTPTTPTSCTAPTSSKPASRCRRPASTAWGVEKLDSMCVQLSLAERAAREGVKAAFDPNGMLNPCKVIPTLYLPPGNKHAGPWRI